MLDLQDTTASADPETAAPPDRTARPPAMASRRPRLQRVLAAAVCALVVGALIFSILELRSETNKASSLEQRTSLFNSAVAAARQYGVYLSSYEYTNLSGPTAAWTEVDSHSTPAFRKDFDSTKASLTSLIQDYKATATGTVSASGVSSVTSSRAVVLVFVDQTVTNSTQKNGPQKQPYRLQLTLARQGGQWLIDAVNAS